MRPALRRRTRDHDVSAGQPRLFVTQHDQLTSDDYYTPSWVFEQMGIEFDLDVCAPPDGVPWIPAARHFSRREDGLLQHWEGRVWMNPPFSKPQVWVERFIIHNHGVCLVPMSMGRWLDPLWGLADGMVLAQPRFEFAGGAGLGIPCRILFAAFGDECVEAISRLGVVRRIA